MKKIPLKTVEIRMDPTLPPGKLSYQEVMTMALERPENPQVGATAGEMRKSIKIMDKIDAAVEADQDHVLLEDDVHKALADRVENYPFAKTNRQLLAIVDEIVDAEDVTVKEVSAG